jgi:hypothetical protein
VRVWLVIAAVVVVLAAGAAMLIARDEPEATFCTAEGLIGPGGETFGRSSSRDCQFVDDRGDLVMTLSNGEPLCYDQGTQTVPCDRPGASSPG